MYTDASVIYNSFFSCFTCLSYIIHHVHATPLHYCITAFNLRQKYLIIAFFVYVCHAVENLCLIIIIHDIVYYNIHACFYNTC